MKNAISKFCLDIEVNKKNNGENEIIINSDFCPCCLKTKDLITFIDCLKVINDMCIQEANERIKNGSSKNKKK